MGKYWTPKTDNVDDVTADIFNKAFEEIETDVSKVEEELMDKVNKNEVVDLVLKQLPNLDEVKY